MQILANYPLKKAILTALALQHTPLMNSMLYYLATLLVSLHSVIKASHKRS